MADLTIQVASRDGLNVTFEAADVAGDAFVNSGNEQVMFINNDASPKTVTVAFQTTVDDQVITCANRTIVIPAGDQFIAGLWRPVSTYNDGNGKVQLTYSDITSLSVAVIKVI